MRYLMMMMLALCVAQPLWADRAARIEAAFEAWVTDVDPDHAVMVLRHEGAEVASYSRGWSVDEPVILASLSKAITAVCAALLVREGRLEMDATSAQILGYGTPGITLAQLVTHGSGLGPDQTQSLFRFWASGAEDQTTTVTQRALKRTSQEATPGVFSYNNENYAVLGAIIAKTTGQSYEQACRQRVLMPAGVRDAQGAEQVGATLPWGGWEMSVKDYAAFMEWAYGPQGVVRAAYQWPALPLNEWVSYGLGMFQRSNGPGYDYWHFGGYCMPLRLNTGSYAAHLGQGWSVVAAFDACLEGEETLALERAMLRTAYP